MIDVGGAKMRRFSFYSSFYLSIYIHVLCRFPLTYHVAKCCGTSNRVCSLLLVYITFI
ncbi:hypothetical protein IFM89_039503 [Coptis chinensis]|uniref:Uncharacterized protein n=1 Tax=Coptis chinensis TaxID=261450 RepID=A0A835GUZ4_9MAGN|nr:hypothetical protein IFM89_039503 [Coptis chinensis]